LCTKPVHGIQESSHYTLKNLFQKLSAVMTYNESYTRIYDDNLLGSPWWHSTHRAMYQRAVIFLTAAVGTLNHADIHKKSLYAPTSFMQ